MNLEKTITVNSLLIAIVIAETNICSIITTFIAIPMISVILMGITICAILLENRGSLKIDRRVFVSFILICLLLIFSMLLNGIEVAGNRLLYFLTFGAGAMFAVNTRFDKVRVFSYLIYIYILHLIIYFLFQRSAILNSDDYGPIQLGLVYSIIPGFNITLACLLFHNGFLSGKKLLLGLCPILFLGCVFVIFFDCYSRGALVTTIICVMIISWKKIGKFLKIVLLIFIMSITVLFISNVDNLIVSALDNFSGNNVKALAKLSLMNNMGDVTNGRGDLYDIAVQLIKENPLFGYGVGYFENSNDSYFPHQFFLEIMCEFGIIGLILFFVPIAKSFGVAFKEDDNVSSLFRMVLLLSSFLPLMFSSSLWLFPLFWVAYFYSLKYGNKGNIIVKNK